MQLCAIVTKDDLVSVARQLTPLRVAVRPRRVITLGRPTKIELVAGAGLRVRGDARFTWDVGGLTIPVTLRSWQVMLVPAFVPAPGRAGGHVLAFDPILEDLDLKNVPMFLDGRIAEAIKGGLAAQKGKLSWDFERQLGITRTLPSQISPAGDVTLVPSGGNVTVTATEMRLELTFAFGFRRDSAPASLRAYEQEMAPSSARAASSR